MGFLAKNHDFDFTVDGYDADGIKVALQFKFKNNKPRGNIKLQKYECSFSAYLEANPAMKQWAELNPETAENERIKL